MISKLPSVAVGHFSNTCHYFFIQHEIIAFQTCPSVGFVLGLFHCCKIYFIRLDIEDPYNFGNVFQLGRYELF